jgi:hypothetical protein
VPEFIAIQLNPSSVLIREVASSLSSDKLDSMLITGTPVRSLSGKGRNFIVIVDC